MCYEPDAYQTYLLRLWRAQCKGRWQWRASIVDPHTGERHWFASLEQLFAYSRDWEVVNRSLKSVNLEHLSGKQINELSGGQQQRVFIARALAQEAELILMDEPFTGLDLTNQQELFTILARLKEQRVTVMIAMHDLKLASERFDRVILLNRKLLGVGKPDEVFAPKNLEAAYGGHLRMIPAEDGILVVEDTCCEEGGHQHA